MTTKLCIDCKHCTASTAHIGAEPLCRKGSLSVVDGSLLPSHTCRVMRQEASYTGPMMMICGVYGEWWEPRAKASTGAP